MPVADKPDKSKPRGRKPPRHDKKHPEPAPEGRRAPHHDARDADPMAHPDYHGHGREAFDPHQTEEESGRVRSIG